LLLLLAIALEPDAASRETMIDMGPIDQMCFQLECLGWSKTSIL